MERRLLEVHKGLVARKKDLACIARELPQNAVPILAFPCADRGLDNYSMALTQDEVVVADSKVVRWRAPVAGLVCERKGNKVTMTPAAGSTFIIHGSRITASLLVSEIEQLQIQHHTVQSTSSYSIPAQVIVADGLDVAPKQLVVIEIDPARVRILTASREIVLGESNGNEVTDYSANGPGETFSGGGYGYIAGDLQSAVQMEAITGWLNDLTTKSQVTTFLRIHTACWALSVVTQHATPDELLLRSPNRSHGNRQELQRTTASLSEEIKNLSELLSKGLLTEEEFSLAKAKLLNNAEGS